MPEKYGVPPVCLFQLSKKTAARLNAIQRRNFYQLYAIITQRGHYCDENTMQFDVRRDDAEATADAEDVITDAMRDLAC